MKYDHIKRIILALAFLAAVLGCTNCGTGKSTPVAGNQPEEKSTVYFTSEITPESLVRIYEALGVEANGRVAVKISTGESSQSNHLRPGFIKDLVDKVDGTLVECNTAYGGNRGTTEKHLEAIAERGYNDIATVDIMDSEGEMKIPVRDTRWIKYDIAGKVYIHTAGRRTKGLIVGTNSQDSFLESMADAAQGVHDYFKTEGKNIVYINVMNNMSVDCDCDGSPLQKRINSKHGTHIVDYAASIGLGSLNYDIVDID